MRTLLAQMVQALDAEINAIEKDQRDRSYELLSGQRDEASADSLYVFVLADALRLPEEASGVLKIGASEVRAMVVAQEGNRLWLLLESPDQLPPYLPSAWLVLNEVELLKKLRQKTEALRSQSNLGLADKVFGKEPAFVSAADIPAAIAARIDSNDAKIALNQCLGSEITFLWGPPGTGKTYSIAHLVASLVDLNESVLVTSHTHAAVEQALLALIKKPDAQLGRKGGPLYDHPLVAAGRILKVGPPRTKDIPSSVLLDGYLKERQREREENIAWLLEGQEKVTASLEQLNRDLLPWRILTEAEAAHSQAVAESEKARDLHHEALAASETANARVRQCEALVVQAKRSFFFRRPGRVARARSSLATAQHTLLKAEASAAKAHATHIRRKAEQSWASDRLGRAQKEVDHLTDPLSAEVTIAELDQQRNNLAAEIATLREFHDDDADTLLENAAAVFATLTKLYVDRTKLSQMQWDTVIIDEASMAMPPLVALAAARARKRVVIVGDMFQLPPIVRSTDAEAVGLLGRDIFFLRGITSALERGEHIPELAMLKVQRRMHPAIAAVAKALIPCYRDLTDAPDTLRPAPALASALGVTNPLVSVDIAELNSWCGKSPGTLSRFNFLSGQAAVELAGLYAASLEEPPSTDPPRIGIVTPYSAQRRYLNQVVKTMGLERWVSAGTVHTFQGSECDVIIFDSVLGEPHWTARLTNPHQSSEVCRDLNVAVTRAKHQFVFVGDARWLKKNAKTDSAYGKLWTHLNTAATHINAKDILGEGFRARVAQSSSRAQGWTIERPAGRVALLNETEFYPAFVSDLAAATRRVVLYTPFIGKTRWPSIEPHISALRHRGVEVFLLHKPLTDREWRQGDAEFGRRVFDSLTSKDVRLIPLSGVHAKTIVIDSHIVYEGSLNWASQTSSYEHMWRFENKDMAVLVEKMLQLEPLIEAYSSMTESACCPKCGGPLILINQAQQNKTNDNYPVKLGCYNYWENKEDCAGYLRRVDGRAPFKVPPTCARGSRMALVRTRTGRPWAWKCGHKTCQSIRWTRGDCEGPGIAR